MVFQNDKERADFGAHKESVSLTGDKRKTVVNTAELDGRLAVHFLHDPRPKFILNSDGVILNANNSALHLIDRGILKRHASGMLRYGSSSLNGAAASILNNLKSGRVSCKRLLKRLPNDNWAVLEFHRVDSFGNIEIVLTISVDDLCPNEGLDAIAVAFDFTVTEAEVVRHMSNASCPKEIGSIMGISINTVRSHLRTIYSKTGARGYNRALRLILLLQA